LVFSARGPSVSSMFRGRPITTRSVSRSRRIAPSSPRSAFRLRRRMVRTGWAVIPSSSEAATPMVRSPTSRATRRMQSGARQRGAAAAGGALGARLAGAVVALGCGGLRGLDADGHVRDAVLLVALRVGEQDLLHAIE